MGFSSQLKFDQRGIPLLALLAGLFTELTEKQPALPHAVQAPRTWNRRSLCDTGSGHGLANQCFGIAHCRLGPFVPLVTSSSYQQSGFGTSLCT